MEVDTTCCLVKGQAVTAHCGFNDITCRDKGPTHLQRFNDSGSTHGSAGMLSQSTQLSHINKDTCALADMSNFIATHNLSFELSFATFDKSVRTLPFSLTAKLQ